MQPDKNPLPKKRRTVTAKIAYVLSWILVCLFALVVIAIIAIQTAPVQNFVRGKVVTYLEKKLKTKVQIGKLAIHFPNSILLKNVLIEDQTKDTLLAGGQLEIGINMLRLLKNEVIIKEINLENITAKIKRLNNDTTFNFQFIADAFATPKDPSAKKDTSAVIMSIDKIVLNNSSVIFKDVMTGNDMNIFITHLDAPIKTFDVNRMYFDIPTFTLSGLRGYFYQNDPLKPIIDSAIAEAVKTPGKFLQLHNSEIVFKDIDFDYKSVPTNISLALKLKSVIAHPDTIDIKNGKFALKDILLDNSFIGVVMSNKQAPPPTAKQQQATAAIPTITITSNNIKITGSAFNLNNTSMPVLNYGMDYGHMDIKDLNLTADNFYYNIDTLAANIKSASFKEKSGFVLNELNTDFMFAPAGTYLRNLYIKTPGTILRKDALIEYPSLAQLAANPALLRLDLNIESSHILIKDLLTFAPMLRTQAAFSNPSQTILLNGRIKGSVGDLHFYDVRLAGLGQTSLAFTGSVTGLPDPKKFNADLNIAYLKTTKRDILSFIPKNTLPATITLPDNITASGKIKGNSSKLFTDVNVTTSLGSAKINGTLQNMTDPKNIGYDLSLTAGNLNLGAIMQMPDKLGTLSGSFKAKGKGFDPSTANANISGLISSVTLNKYTYKNIKINGNIANQHFNTTASINDPNINLTVDANGIMNGEFPSLHLVANIDSIKTQPLNFTPQTLLYHGKIEADFTNTDPDNLAGNFLITHSILVNNGQRITVDSLEVIADNSGGAHSLTLKSDFIGATIKGDYKLTQLADVFQQAIDPYFAMSAKKNAAKVSPYNFTINGSVIYNAALKAFLPTLTQMKTINFGAHFAIDSGWNAFATAPYTVYGDMIIDDLKFNAVTKNGALTFTTSLNQFKSGKSLAVFATSLDGSLQNNNLDFTLNIKDAKSVNKYTVSGVLGQPSLNNYSFSLKPDNLLLNYNKWSASNNNSIQYFNKDITANNFVLMQGNQELSLNTIGTGTNKPLSIDFKNFNIATITGFVQSDSLLVGGTLNGNATIKNIQTQPAFTTDLTVNDLSVYKDTLGNLTAKVNNNIANQFNADVRLVGRGNEVNLTGDYFVRPANKSTFDLNLDIVALQMRSLEAFTKGSIKNSRGNLFGKVAFNGSAEDPNIDGKINFNNTAFTVSALNSVFKIDKEAIAVVNTKGIELSTFTIRDTAENAIVLDGNINTPDWFNYSFDLKINADNFQAINSTKKDNKLFYGKMVFSTALTIKGTPTHPVIDGSLTVNDKTNFSVVLPQNEPGVVQRDGIVRFVDYSATADDSLFMRPYDSLKTSALLGFDVSVNINVNKEATFNLIVDEGNGDFLRLKGEGQLTGGIDASGKVTLVGSYEINDGSYDLSFNFIKRKFLIQKGSRIVWTGEPTTANVDVTAIYIANTPPLDLVQGQIEGDPNIYKQKLPFEVHLGIAGELLQPQINFDIILPQDKNYNVSSDIINTVENKLTQMRQEPGELNKQVFALLLLNRFVGENPFDNSSGGSIDANTFARQSVSRLLTEQLNKLGEGLIEGVDINFDLATTEDYTSGSKQQRTDFNIGLSKRLLNDRLTVTVGSNFELEGPRATNQQQNNVAGNIAVDYKLSKDGRYMLRAYRKNDYTGAIEGYVIETGVGFIISVDYNRFKEILQQRRSNKNLRKKEKTENKIEKAEAKTEEKSAPPVKENEDGK